MVGSQMSGTRNTPKCPRSRSPPQHLPVSGVWGWGVGGGSAVLARPCEMEAQPLFWLYRLHIRSRDDH